MLACHGGASIGNEMPPCRRRCSRTAFFTPMKEQTMQTTSRDSIYTRITNRIVAALENGVVPWQKPWISQPHRNAVSQRPYRGINVLQLELTAQEQGYRSSAWLTFRQAKELGGYVRQGEHG